MINFCPQHMKIQLTLPGGTVVGGKVVDGEQVY